MKNILVVCTGNICRTPMAKALLDAEFARRTMADLVQVDSAGVYAVVGAPASAGSVHAMAERGIDITEHRGKQLDAALVRGANLILVMEEDHRRSIFYSWPDALRKTFLLSEMAGEHDDIEDPYGLDQPAYDETAALLEDIIRRGMPNIMRRLDIDEKERTNDGGSPAQ